MTPILRCYFDASSCDSCIEMDPPLGNLDFGENITAESQSPDRSVFSARDVVNEVWFGLGLPGEALSAIHLPGKEGPALPSSFKLGILGQGAIGLSALAAAQFHALRNQIPVPATEIPLEHAAIEYNSEKLYVLEHPPSPSSRKIGGLHKTVDGHVRVHDGFPNHADGMVQLLGLPHESTREQVADKLSTWKSIDLENAAVVDGKLAAYALRSYREWDSLEQSKAIRNFPIDVTRIGSMGGPAIPVGMPGGASKCLNGLRVVEMSRVIAAPLCGKTLAAHGADIIWVTSPNLPDLPALDREFARGKRTVSLDIDDPADKARLLELLRTCRVFVQGYRPGSLAARGLSPEELAASNPGIVVANMSAFGPRGPWSGRRGFDSLVQTCSGMNVSEAEHAGQGEAARPMPCQALDHTAGYMLATGIVAALYRRGTQGGSWRVDVSLAGVMKYLRSLGQYPSNMAFRCKSYDCPADVPDEYYETRSTGFGRMKSIRPSATIQGCEVGWDVMPKPLGLDVPEWRDS